jgi:hypothetical protein
MSPEQIQDIVMGTIAAAMDTGDLIGGSPEMREVPQMEDIMAQAQQEQPEQPMMEQPEMEQPMMEQPEMPEQPPEGMM